MDITMVGSGTGAIPPETQNDANRTQSASQAQSDGLDSEAGPSTVVMLSGDSKPADNSQPSDLKSFGYGVMGLGTPKSAAQVQAETPAQQQTDDYYSLGRLATTALTIGAVISLLA
jgi:hypothetical protein